MGYWPVAVSALVRHDKTVSIDPDSPVAPYRQVAAILVERIESGTYTTRLPSIADLTGEFGIARTTAAKALRLLVDEGLAEVSPGMGTYVRKD
jgi:DNA-binding GntR family transcriptional regulator